MSYRFVPITTPDAEPVRRKVNQIVVRRIVVGVLLLLAAIFGGAPGFGIMFIGCILYGRHLIKAKRRANWVASRTVVKVDPSALPYDGMSNGRP